MSEDLENKVAPVQGDENHIIAERRAKLAQLRAEGVAIPTTSNARTSLATLLKNMATWIRLSSKPSRFRWLVLVV